MNNAKKAALALAAAGVAVGTAVVPAIAYDGGANAAAIAKGSPGVISGNVIQVPIEIPINLCGNSIDIVSLLNPTFGNTCINEDVHPVHMSHYEEHSVVHHHHGDRGREGREGHGHDRGREGRENDDHGREGRE